MRILLAQPRGYCAGVDMAIEALSRAVALFPAPVYCFHQIVHNQAVVRDFEQRGVKFVDDVTLVPEGATLVFSAHGVSPQVRQHAMERGLRLIDATCPLVAKVHDEARTFARDGLSVVLIGHPGHDEVSGVLGEAERIAVVETLADIENLQVDNPARMAYVTQTTLSVDDTRHLVTALQKRFPRLAGPAKDDICYATQNRQEAVRKLAVRAQLALIVGSANSSNSQRLAEVARQCGIPAYLINGPESIALSWFQGVSTVLVTSGASVPDQVLLRSVRWLEENFEAVIEEPSGKQELVRFPQPVPVRFQAGLAAAGSANRPLP